MTVLIFLAVLFVLILVHEWGHFIAAKKTGMRVDEFGIGFPPKLWSIKKGETEYSFNLLPIGGFVRIYGENPTDVGFSPVADEGSDRRSEASAEAGEGGAKVVLKNTPQDINDYERSFVAKSKWAQAFVLVAGVTMNVLLAWVLFITAFAVGVPTAVDEVGAGPEARLVVASVLADSPAERAGLQAGMEILKASRGGEELLNPTPTSFSNLTKASDETISITTVLGDSEETITISPEKGVVASDPEVLAVGVSLSMVETQALPLFSAIKEGTITTATSLKAIAVGLFTLLGQSIQGTADLSQVSGPVGIVGLVGDAASFGLTSLLMFTAIISLNLAIINLLPIPALDGGRLVFVAIEAITRRELNPIWVARVNLVGFAFLMLLIVAVTYSDIFLK